jgi:hypothetical protein
MCSGDGIIVHLSWAPHPFSASHSYNHILIAASQIHFVVSISSARHLQARAGMLAGWQGVNGQGPLSPQNPLTHSLCGTISGAISRFLG